jgi:hypothetical protein
MASNRDQAYLQRALAPRIGDVTQRGFESRRAALDQAIANIQGQGRVMHTGSPGGEEYGRGDADHYAGYITFGGNKHLNAIIDEVARLEKEAPKELREIATRRGYYGAHRQTSVSIW